MTRYFFRGLGLIALVILAVGLVSGGAVAQEANATATPNASATTAPTATIDATATPTSGPVEDAADAAQPETDTPRPAVGSVGPIEILDYELRDGTMTLTLRVTDHTPYALSDSQHGVGQQGVTEDISYKKGALSPGIKELSLSVVVSDNVGGVSLSTRNDYARIQSEPLESSKDPVSYQTAQGLVAGSAIFGAAGVFMYVRRKRNDEEHGPERIL